MGTDKAIKILAGTTADAIRERLIAYTPVTSAHQAVVLAYTRRQLLAIEEVTGAEFDVDDIRDGIHKAVMDAEHAGFPVPDLP